MRKKLLIGVCLLLTAVFALSGCSSYSNVKVEDPQTDTDYIVYSNGGMTVQYGEYVYFINGTRGYSDEEGKSNRWNEVVKGGIYRAKLNVERDSTGKAVKNGQKDVSVKTTASSLEPDKLYDFEFGTQKKYGDRPDLYDDYKEALDEEIDVVKNTAIAPKTVGTSGYNKGIFIFDDYIYFATPNNQKNREGAVQTGYTDFMRMRLDGRNVKKIFTTEGEASDQPYGFYKMGDSMFLVCSYKNDDGKLDVVSVRMKDNKIYNPVYLSREATSLYIPSQETYDKNDKSVTLEDFVYYTRDVREGENKKQGNVIEIYTPDGSEGFSFFMSGQTTSIEDVRDDSLFYTVDNLGNTEVKFTNLYSAMAEAEIKYYTEYEKTATEKRGQIDGYAFRLGGFSDLTTKYYFRGHALNNAGYMLGFSSDGVYLFSDFDANYKSGFTVLPFSAEMLFVRDGYLYYIDGLSIFRIYIFNVRDRSDEGELLTDRDIVSSGLKAGFAVGHLTFFSTYDQWTESGTGYTYFIKINRIGTESFMIGSLAEEDVPDDETLEAFLAGETTEG